jgi:hypothetical protein
MLIDQDAWNATGDAAAPEVTPIYTWPLRPWRLTIPVIS